MEQNTLRKQRELTDRLNRYRNEYYNYNLDAENHQKGIPVSL